MTADSNTDSNTTGSQRSAVSGSLVVTGHVS
jgi:hypothetical protein